MAGDAVKATVTATELGAAVRFAAAAVGRRPSQPALAGLLLTVDGDTGAIAVSGFDFDVAHTATASATEASEGGRVLVSAALLDTVLARLRGDVQIAESGGRLALVCGTTSLSLPLLPVEDFPGSPELPPAIGTLDADVLRDAVGAAADAADVSGSALPALTGVRMEIEAGTLTLAATDRYRLHLAEVAWAGGDAAPMLVPAAALRAAVRPMSGQVQVHGDSGRLGLSDSRLTVTIRLLDAEFPRYRSLLREPANDAAHLVCDTELLTAAVSRCEPLVPSKAPLRFEFTGGTLTLRSQSDLGEVLDEVPAEGEGTATVALRPAFLLDALAAAGGGTVRLGFDGELRTVSVRGADGRQALVMPVRSSS